MTVFNPNDDSSTYSIDEHNVSPVVITEPVASVDTDMQKSARLEDYQDEQEKRDRFNRILSEPRTTQSTAIDFASKILVSNPNLKSELSALIIKQFGISQYAVDQALTASSDLSVGRSKFGEALDSLAEKVEADFELEDLLPSTAAAAIRASCDRDLTDWKSSVFYLFAVVSTLVGSKVMVKSTRNGALDLVLLLFNCGNSSSNKSITSDKFIAPLKGMRERYKKNHKSRLVEASKITDPNDKREELEKIQHSREDTLANLMSFSAEGFLRLLLQQKRRQGLHLHQDEGSDIFACERWGGGSGEVLGLFRKTLIELWKDPLCSSNNRVDSSKCIDPEEQTITLTANLQLRFVPDILDFSEDSLGWTARCIVVEAKGKEGVRPRSDGTNDPISDFLNERVIPWVSNIRSSPSNRIDASGLRMDYTLLKLDPWSGADKEYDAFIAETDAMKEKGEAQGKEPAWLYFLAKTSIRVMKFAAILHILECLQGKHIDGRPGGDGEMIYKPKGDPLKYLVGEVNTERELGISVETFRRAVKVEMLARREYQNIADICRAAPAIREENLLKGEYLAKAQFVLDKLQGFDTLKESDFKNKLKGSKGLAKSDITNAVVLLTERGCIERTKQGKTFVLRFIKPIR